MQQLVPALLAAMLILAPLSARSADLVVWWSEGYTNQEDEAVREVIAAFEEKTGKQVELVLHPEPELPDTVVAAVEAGKPPDFVFSALGIQDDVQWAYDGRLVDLTDAVGYFADQFDPYALDLVTLLDGTTGRRGLYLLPVGDSPRPRLEEPAGAGGLHARGHPERVARLLVVLVRPGTAGGATGARP